MNSEAAGTEWIRKSDAQELVTKWREWIKDLGHCDDADLRSGVEECADSLAEVIARNVQPSPDAVEIADRLLEKYGVECGITITPGKFANRIIYAPEFTEAIKELLEARPVPQPATEPLILANLTKHEFERLSHGRIPYSGAAGDPHYDKDPRPWGKHAPYIATYLGELIPAVKAMKWTHFSVKHEHGQWLALRDVSQGQTEIFKPDHIFDQFAEMWRCTSCYQAWLRNAISHCCCEEFNQRIRAACQVPVSSARKEEV